MVILWKSFLYKRPTTTESCKMIVPDSTQTYVLQLDQTQPKPIRPVVATYFKPM